MNTLLHRLRRSRIGAALVEYCILVGLIAVAVIFAVLLLGSTVREIFFTVDANLASSVQNLSADEVADLIGNDPVALEWTNTANHPDDASCFPTDVNGNYDPTYTCFLLDATANADYGIDLGSDPDENTVKINGPGPDYPPYAMISTGPGGSLIIYEGTNDTPVEIYGNSGEDNVYFTGATCDDLEIIESFFLYELNTPGDYSIWIDSSVDNVYCPGDDTVLTIDEIIERSGGDGSSGGGDGGDYEFPGNTG